MSSGIVASYFDEPLLRFADGGQHVDPKEGISRFGPRSWSPRSGHPQVVRIGLVGTAETVERAETWFRTASRGIPGEGPHLAFPGFAADRGFFSELDFSDGRVQLMSSRELTALKKITGDRAVFEANLGLLEEKLALLAENDEPLDYVAVALPAAMLTAARIARYTEVGRGTVVRSLRRAFKARAMRYRIPTQVILPDTTSPTRRKGDDHPAEVAWDMFTGLYFKAGGAPWGPTGLPPNTCYLGVSFYRPLGSDGSRIQTSLVQAFDENGEGLVLRGHEFEWDQEKEGTRSPHLTSDMASALVTMALDRYERETKIRPRRVVVHKTSRYSPAEADGFRAALGSRADFHDLLALSRANAIALFPESKYPALRGTRFRLGELDYLYTKGYMPDLGEFTDRHIPTPLQLSDHIGHDTSRDQLLREVFALTKLNWNSARMGGLDPITIRFSERVGDILKEVPDDVDPLPQSKFYM